MPKSLSTARYNPRYFDILTACLDEGKPVTLTLPRGQAQWLRHDFYAFRKALHAEHHPDARRSEAIVIRLGPKTGPENDDPCELTFVTPDQTTVGQALDAALESLNLPSSAPQPDYLGSTDFEFPTPPGDDETDEAADTLSSLGYESTPRDQ